MLCDDCGQELQPGAWCWRSTLPALVLCDSCMIDRIASGQVLSSITGPFEVSR